MLARRRSRLPGLDGGSLLERDDRAAAPELIASDGEEGDLLGFSVAIDGDKIVAGAPETTSVPAEIRARPTRSRARAPPRAPTRAS